MERTTPGRGMLARALLALAVALALAGCVANPGPKGFPGTEANPGTGAYTVILDDDTIMPKQTWVTVGTAVTFKDLQGSAHALRMENRGNATIEVPANATATMTWDAPGDIRLVCAMHGPAGMRGWLHVV